MKSSTNLTIILISMKRSSIWKRGTRQSWVTTTQVIFALKIVSSASLDMQLDSGQHTWNSENVVLLRKRFLQILHSGFAQTMHYLLHDLQLSESIPNPSQNSRVSSLWSLIQTKLSVLCNSVDKGSKISKKVTEHANESNSNMLMHSSCRLCLLPGIHGYTWVIFGAQRTFMQYVSFQEKARLTVLS